MKKNHVLLKSRFTHLVKQITTSITALLLLLALVPLQAETMTIYTNNFEGYTDVATGLDDVSDADPTGIQWNIGDDNPAGGTAGSGVQVINWESKSSPNALLLRSGTWAEASFAGPVSGPAYTLDFWMYAKKAPGNRGFRITLRGQGGDRNEDDYLAYGNVQATANTIRYYDGVDNTPVGGYWSNTVAVFTEEVWQHHRVTINPVDRKMTLYIDDMDTPVLDNVDLGRSDVPVPTSIRFQHEGDSLDDGYIVIDDVLFTVDTTGTRDLSTTFTEGFEDYAARTSESDDANPGFPWITVECVGAGAGRTPAPTRVQVVDASVMSPRSGNKCLKLEGGQRANVSIAWGVPPQADVQITWWAKVPASPIGGEYVYLRMSLYGAEGGNSSAGDSALLGYGCRSATVGDATSLTYFTTTWVDTGLDFTDGVWEEYRLTTHNAVGRYTIIKNPSGSSPQVVVDRAPYIGAGATWGPSFMAAWSSSNVSGHPPVYIDDIEIKSLVSNPDPLPTPYTVEIEGDRFTNSTVLALSGPVGAVAVDPRDNSSFVFAVDASVGGTIHRATKVASGNWAVDPTPVVTGLANPSGLTIGSDGTLWWLHDFSQALMRLKWPWNSNTPELVIADFILPGATVEPGNSYADDDPFDLCFSPANFTGSIGQPNRLVIMDRGVDDNPNNALFLVDPATTELNQVNYQNYLFGPTTSGLGVGDLVALTPLAQSAEVVTLCLDGQVTAVDANGTARFFWPDFYADPSVPIQPAAMAADPNTGRLWIADDLFNEVWSCAGDGTAGQKEISFPLTNPGRPELQTDFQEPGMTFAPNGSFLVVSDTSTVNGGGRLIILHNETIALPTFAISSVVRGPEGVALTWESAGGAKYDVLRGTDVANAASFTAIATDLTSTSYTDTSAPAGAAFYRVVAKP